jgi:hypothetical protein
MAGDSSRDGERRMASVVPMAKALTLCDRVVGQPRGKVDLYGVFNAIRPTTGYPFVLERFRVFAQLGSGLGRVEFHVEVRFAATDGPVFSTTPRPLHFPDRDTVLQLSLGIDRCPFNQPGVYLVELYCDNVWVCDTRLLLHEAGGDVP